MQDHFFPNPGKVRNMKPTYVSGYFITGKANRLRHVKAKTKICLVMSLCLIKGMRKFYVLNNIIYAKREPKKGSISRS